MKKYYIYHDLAKRLDQFVDVPSIGYPKFSKKWYKNNITAILIEKQSKAQIDNVQVPTFLRFRLQIGKSTSSAFILPQYMPSDFEFMGTITRKKEIAQFFDFLMPNKQDDDIVQYDLFYIPWTKAYEKYPEETMERIHTKQEALFEIEHPIPWQK